MGKTTFKTLARLAERSMQIGRNGTDGALKAAMPALESEYLAYMESDRQFRMIENEELDGRAGREEMVDAFGQAYDKTISAIRVQKPHAQLPERASTMRTPDDLLNGARSVVDFLKKPAGVDETHPIDGQGDAAPQGEPWAIDMLRDFLAELAAAEAVLHEATTAGQRRQRAVEDRAKRREALEARLLAFRRLVRDTYGRHSREYRSLRGRGEPAENDVPPTPPPEPAPAASEPDPA